jgi:hypothetical protein
MARPSHSPRLDFSNYTWRTYTEKIVVKLKKKRSKDTELTMLYCIRYIPLFGDTEI